MVCDLLHDNCVVRYCSPPPFVLSLSKHRSSVRASDEERTTLRQAQGERERVNAVSKKIIVIDEGTTSTRTMLFAADGTPLGSAQREIRQHYPGPGLVEHDDAEIWDATIDCTREMVERAGGAEHIEAIGIRTVDNKPELM